MRYEKLIGDETRAFPDISNIFVQEWWNVGAWRSPIIRTPSSAVTSLRPSRLHRERIWKGLTESSLRTRFHRT